jgi:hypothetical protein
MPARVLEHQIKRYVKARIEGHTQASAGRLAGVSIGWASKYESSRMDDRTKSLIPGKVSFADRAEQLKPGAKSDEASRALEDFEFFRARFFGRVSTPWQIEAGILCRDLLATSDKEFVVMNCPPGAGKSTLLHDIMCWLIARDRSVRLLIGSRTHAQASKYSERIRSNLERVVPMEAKEEELKRGLATDADSSMSLDYGPFRPDTGGAIWRRDQFTVVLDGGHPTDEKEATVTSFGMDSGQLGHRVNGVFWDDLVDTSTVRTEQAKVNQKMWYEDEAETRLEPGGLLVLCGQRIAADDLYRHCLDMPAWSVTELDAEDEYDATQLPRKYTHIVFPAHFDDRCSEEHKPSVAKAYPEGCLLDPVRVPWRELRAIRAAREQKYRVLYQQEDVDPGSVLVPKIWVDGGRDSDGEVFPGCWDNERRICELPKGLQGPLISVASVDPSPSKFWAIVWEIIQPATGLRFVMDLFRNTLDASAFLDFNAQDRVYYGIMEDWQRRSSALGLPITHWIVEQNAAQRFMLQYEHFRTWMQQRNVRVIGHDTGRNKADAEFGFEASLQPIFRRGLLRLPGFHDNVSRIASLRIVDEATRYPESPTDDTLMALWFIEYNLRNIQAKDPSSMPRYSVPSWVRPEVA